MRFVILHNTFLGWFDSSRGSATETGDVQRPPIKCFAS